MNTNDIDDAQINIDTEDTENEDGKHVTDAIFAVTYHIDVSNEESRTRSAKLSYYRIINAKLVALFN